MRLTIPPEVVAISRSSSTTWQLLKVPAGVSMDIPDASSIVTRICPMTKLGCLES
jgi:hypothetical protein